MRYLALTILLCTSVAVSGRLWTTGFGVAGSGKTGSVPFWGQNNPEGYGDASFGGAFTYPVGRCTICAFDRAIQYQEYTSGTYHGSNGVGISPGHRPVYIRKWVYFPTSNNPHHNVPQCNQRIAFLFQAGGAHEMDVIWGSSDKISIAFDQSIVATTSSVVPRDRWTLLKIYSRNTTSGNVDSVYFDGQPLADASHNFTDTLAAFYHGFGNNACNSIGDEAFYYTDDVAINDTAGAYENTWPNDSAFVVTSYAESDVSIMDWRGGGSGSTNLWKGLGNATPRQPLGTNGTEADTNNITNSNSTGNDSVVINLQSYTTAGIAAGYTVTVLQPYVRTGSHASSETTAGSFRLISNPVTPATTFNFNDGTNAHVGDYNTAANTLHWVTHLGTAVYRPTISLGSNLVISITKVDATSHKVCADAAGAVYEIAPIGGSTHVPIYNNMER